MTWTGRLARRQVLRGGAGLAAGSAALLLACGGGDSKGGTGSTTSSGGGASTAATTTASGSPAAPKRGGKLVQAYESGTNSLNPITDSGQRLSLGAQHVWDRLVSNRPAKQGDKEFVLEAAASLEQPDGTTLIFKLKPGMKFQNRAPVNGRAVEAEDIVKAQLYVRDEPRAGNNAFQKTLASIEAPDAGTVVMKLKGPNAYIFSGTSLGDPGAQAIFAREQIGSLETAWSVGSGPYEMAEYELNQRYLYKKFAGFRGADTGLPYIDEREFRVIQDAAAVEAAFRSEQIQVWRLRLNAQAATLKKEMGAKIEMDEFSSLELNTMNANVTKAPYNDVRVREALYRLVNRKQYLDLIQQGLGKVPPGPLPAGLTEYQLTEAQTEKYFRQDARAAKQLLDAAGFDYNKEIEISTIARPDNNQGTEIFQQQLSQVGVKTKIVPMPVAEFLSSRISTGSWETFVAGWPGYDTPQVPLRLQHTDTQHIHKYAGLKDPVIDAQIEKSEVTLDKNERIKLVKEIQLALLEKYTPMIHLYNNTAYQARWRYVRDWEIHASIPGISRPDIWLDK